MLTNLITKQHVIERMSHCYFSYAFEDYILHLQQHGYKPETIKVYCQCIEHFGQWLKSKQITSNHIEQKHINNFLQKHLSRCKCSLPRTREIKTIRAAINQLLNVTYKNKSFLSPINNQTSNTNNILNDFDNYLIKVCGYAENTRIYRKRYTLAFLKQVKISDLSEIEKVTPQQIKLFIKSFSHHYKNGSIGVVSTSLRSFLRFSSFCGYNVRKLVAAVPRIPNYKLSSIPKFLCDTEIKKFLSVFNRKDLSAKRDYAMARCLTDLGLRCCEVANIKIKDINWHHGILKIARSKSNQEDQLPLLKSVGDAISDYLLHGRPKSNSEFIFVFHRAPFGEAVRTGTVRNAIRRAFQNAGFDPIPGTHILRRSFATKLLISGSSLKEIADILGHRSIDTTMIYTKVDLPNLQRVAMPCLGEDHE